MRPLRVGGKEVTLGGCHQKRESKPARGEGRGAGAGNTRPKERGRLGMKTFAPGPWDAGGGVEERTALFGG